MESKKTDDYLKRLSKSITNLNKAEDRKRIRVMERIWIRDTPKVCALNYWFYRYLTNEFELYILDAIKFVEVNREEFESLEEDEKTERD